jgi:hypothetical protein
MGLLKRLAYLLSVEKRNHRQHHRGDFHKRCFGRSGLMKTNPVSLSNKIESEFCLMCKNHCNLAMVKCEKGKAYAMEIKSKAMGAS